MDQLIKDGINLNRHYTHKYCSPTRSAIQSGRNPIHVNVQNVDPTAYNANDPVAGFSGIARNMTGLAEMMKRGGYKTHFAGKWDAGMATFDHTPHGRGYDSSLHYFHHMNDYWQAYYVHGNSRDLEEYPAVDCSGTSYSLHTIPIDLWLAKDGYEGPAKGLNWTGSCATEPANVSYPYWNVCPDDGDGSECPPYPGFPGEQVDGCIYEDALFLQFVTDVINKHDPSEPLFLFWAPHIVHTPLQVPKSHLDRFQHVADWRRRRYLAMVNYLDEAIGQVVDLLKSRHMYNDTLIAFSSDNGGPVYQNGTSGANNYPLRGGKASNWEGGVRVNAWASGGLIPESMRSRSLSGLSTAWDWWATFAAVGGIEDIADHKAAAAGLPPIDSVNLWPYWNGSVGQSPRKLIPLGSCVSKGHVKGYDQWCTNSDDKTTVGGVIVDMGSEQGLWKLIREEEIGMNGWQGVSFPNSTTSRFEFYRDSSCGSDGPGCLFKLDEDPTEHNNLAETKPDVVEVLAKILDEAQTTVFSPSRGKLDAELSCAAAQKYGGYWGPFVE
mmetsp:Transcript_22600/g.44013  ORF Transcript_22600/g.44013 Transcript_22600/m.44013 type:complete len:550 (-) Transcript_22600:210-1859(-)